jgi:hypothetical protein
MLRFVTSRKSVKSKVKKYSPGCMEQAPNRGHEASPQSWMGVGCKLCPSSKSCVGILESPVVEKNLFAFPCAGQVAIVHSQAFADSVVAVCLCVSYLAYVPVPGVLGFACCQLVSPPCFLARWRADVLTLGAAGVVSGMAPGSSWV